MLIYCVILDGLYLHTQRVKIDGRSCDVQEVGEVQTTDAIVEKQERYDVY